MEPVKQHAVNNELYRGRAELKEIQENPVVQQKTVQRVSKSLVAVVTHLSTTQGRVDAAIKKIENHEEDSE